MEPKTISINVTYAETLTKIKQHLSVLGKRAKFVNGESMFSDFHPSANEESVFYDLIDSAAESLVGNLPEICSSYKVKSGTNVTNGIYFEIILTRYRQDVDASKDRFDVTKAVEDAVKKYLYNFALAQYLAIIHPGTGDKYPPRWGVTYQEQCAIIISNIKLIIFDKKPATISSKSYADVQMRIP